MNTITNRQAICDTLLAAARTDRDIVVVCSDSRGSASLSAFADQFPEQFVEIGDRRAEPGYRVCWPCLLWEKSVCSFPGLFPLHQEL